MVSVEELGRLPATPYQFQLIENGAVEPVPQVVAELNEAEAAARRVLLERLALTPRKEVFIGVHGVSNKFDDAILGTAELWHFMGREGVPIAYTWPAGAPGLFFYTTDRESCEFTVLHLKQMLKVLATIPEVEKINLLAHSRGTDVATTALRELVIEARAAGIDPRQHFRIDNLILAAADIDIEVASQRIAGEALDLAVGRMTIYTNISDSALSASGKLFSSRLRLGALNPDRLTPLQKAAIESSNNLDIIIYKGSGGGIFRHSYYRDPAISSDMLMLLRYGWLPGEGGRRTLEPKGKNIWTLED
jgi:esterase/lipase superfamily enzyme